MVSDSHIPEPMVQDVVHKRTGTQVDRSPSNTHPVHINIAHGQLHCSHPGTWPPKLQ